MRLAGNYRRYKPIVEVHRELDIEYILKHIKKINENYFREIENHTNMLMKDIQYENIKYRHERILNILYNT